MKLILISLVIFTSLISAAGFAEVTDKGFQNQHRFRFTIRSDDDDYDLYSTRINGFVEYRLPRIERTLRIAPFFEYQSNFDTNTWWRKEIGAEIGAFFFDRFFYYGASFQHVWQKEENYPVERLLETTEWESRFVFTYPIQWGIFKDKVKAICYDEYTYDFTRGQATINEVGVVLDWQVWDWLHLPVGWSHIDRIHDFDSDLLEVSVVFSF